MSNQSKRRPQHWCSVVLAIIALATMLRVWAGPPVLEPAAYGQIPDSGMQRKLLLEEARRTNQILVEIRSLLTSHTFNVRSASADNQADQRAPGARK